MLTNHFKIAWRSLSKNKLYTVINILGLTIGIAAALLIFKMVSFETSFNKDFSNYDRIVRAVSVETSTEGETYHVCIPTPAMEVMRNSVPQFEAMSKIKEMWASIIVPDPNGGPPLKKFSLEPGHTSFFAESEYFEIFDLHWLQGDSSQALDEVGSIVLSESWADKTFDGWKNAMGQTVLLDNVVPVIVKGVYSDLPSNCDFTLPYLVSYNTLEANAELFFHNTEWGSCSSNDQVYALLGDPSQLDQANTALKEVGKEEYTNEERGKSKYHVLQPISDLHYSDQYQNSGTHRSSRSRLMVLSGIGILILIMACFNFINLATAQSTLRSKEVGVRKTLGSTRRQLTNQFLIETLLLVSVSVGLGALLANLTLPLLAKISEVPTDVAFISDPNVLGFLGLLIVLVTMLAGLYPAMRLSGFKPIEAIRSHTGYDKHSGAGLRKTLVVAQFVIAQALIAGALINILQLDYIRSRDLGFNHDLVYTFSFNADSMTVARQGVLKQTLRQIPTVTSVSFSSDQPFSGNTWASNFRYGSRPEDEPYGITMKFCDEDYMETYGISLIAGKWYERSDTMRDGVVNKTLMDKLGITNPEEMIGEHVHFGRRKVRIVGVSDDFHTHSLRQAHRPLIMSTRKEFYWDAGVKIRPDDIAGTTRDIKAAFDEVLPAQVFRGRFMDEHIARFYQDDQRLSSTTKAFGILAILISCLGLFGLATHAAAQRTKEIGIRKVLGATIGNIVYLLSKDFLKLILIALIIAVPLAIYFMDKWLNNFVFRIDMPYWAFILTGVLAVAIALLTVSYQSIRAASSSPINALKDE